MVFRGARIIFLRRLTKKRRRSETSRNYWMASCFSSLGDFPQSLKYDDHDATFFEGGEVHLTHQNFPEGVGAQ
ncbi:hypothetical protein QR680_012574 [Steinernema hermaphroditum]|uniref:Uncharacterized protein n=1 Tax=Steinernema hermaphroditum TaxID=289476 RepID=A0AA39M0R1_9BILA|nr:hypothetical protein QR680_012574 [Steinernema hermaphroditum]